VPVGAAEIADTEKPPIPGAKVKVAWVGKGILAVLDQGLFASTNFIVNILLARWLSPAEYGAFALAFSVLLLVGFLHTACLTEPMMVFGPGKYSLQVERYVELLFWGHFALMLPVALLLAASGIIIASLHFAQVGHTLIGAGIACPLILLLWLVRRAFYVTLRPAWTVVGGTLYLLSLLPMVWILRRVEWLSPATALVAMGFAASAVCAILFVPLCRGGAGTTGVLNPREVALEHWRYGRWSLATVVTSWLPTNIYFVIVPVWLGFGAAGGLRAISNLSMPALQTIAALSLILTPTLVVEHQRTGTAGMNRLLKLYSVLLSVGGLFYLGLLWANRFLVFRLLYAGKYTEYSSLPLFVACLLPFAQVVSTAVGSGLRALERPDYIFWCYLGSAFVAVLFGVPLTARCGVLGAIIVQLLSAVTLSVGMLAFYRKASRVEEARSINTEIVEVTQR
jgi:O-antigen/teichoic acid export membrane protein